jgi:hypothetical protein
MLREQAFGNTKANVRGLTEELRYQHSGARTRIGGETESHGLDSGAGKPAGDADTFFSAVLPKRRCFFAKRTPLSEDPRRVIVGAARCTYIGESVEYRYTTSFRTARHAVERMVTHSATVVTMALVSLSRARAVR